MIFHLHTKQNCIPIFQICDLLLFILDKKHSHFENNLANKYKCKLNRDKVIVAKGEISHHEEFILLSQCFQKPSAKLQRHQNASV